MAQELIDNQQSTSAREKMLEKLRARHQDIDFDDEEQLWGAIGGDYGDYENQLQRSRDVDAQMEERFNNDPNFAGLFLDIVGGKTPVQSLIERYGSDFREYLDDPDKQEELAEANQKYLERVSKEKELEEVYEKNIQTSLGVAEELEAEGYSEEEVNEAFQAVLNDAEQAILGGISREMLELKLKGLNYDRDVQEAEQSGEARAKNAKYMERKKDASELSDLPPVIDGRDAQAIKKETDPRIEALDKVTNKGDIWAGAKRKPI